MTMSLIVQPFSLINVSVGVDQATETIRSVVFPMAVISGAIEPDLDTQAFSHIGSVEPFAFIFSPIFELNYRSLDLGVTFLPTARVVERSQFLEEFINIGIVVLLVVYF
jgi:hypothetical protein